MLWYIPGCDVRRNHPASIGRAMEYFKAKNIPEGPCCRRDLSMLEDGDTLITDCTQCNLIFAERTPHVKIISLYEFLLNDPEFVWPKHSEQKMVLQDCLRMRDNPALHHAVRACLKMMKVSFEELPIHRENADFCGVWLNNPAAPDCVEAAPRTFAVLEKHRHLLSPDVQKGKMEAYVNQLPLKDVIVYCSGCEKGIRLGKGMPHHMIDLLFGTAE